MPRLPQYALLVGDAEELAHELRAVSQVLLDQLGADDAQECCRRLVGDGLGQQRLARARHAVQDHTLRRLDTHLFVQLGVRQWQLHGFL